MLIDHDVEGYVRILWGTLASEGWLDLVSLQPATLSSVGLSVRSPDRVVWRFVQQHGMLLLTNNRNMEGNDSLDQTIREEWTPSSLPVLTFGNLDRLVESAYRAQCAERLVEIVMYPERYQGVGRIFIP